MPHRVPLQVHLQSVIPSPNTKEVWIRCFADGRQKLRNIPSHNLVDTFFCPLREPCLTVCHSKCISKVLYHRQTPKKDGKKLDDSLPFGFGSTAENGLGKLVQERGGVPCSQLFNSVEFCNFLNKQPMGLGKGNKVRQESRTHKG